MFSNKEPYLLQVGPVLPLNEVARKYPHFERINLPYPDYESVCRVTYSAGADPIYFSKEVHMTVCLKCLDKTFEYEFANKKTVESKLHYKTCARCLNAESFNGRDV